jgi:uncharacterized delta-60 repeat protein
VALYVLLTLSLVTPVLVAMAAAGDLDPTFGTGGKVTTDFGGADAAFAVALQSDGKVVAAGTSDPGSNRNFAAARYLTDGSLDTTFGTGGKVTTDLGGADIAYSVAIQGDGKIVAAGGDGGGFGLARYTVSGGLDTTFGTGGKVNTDFGDSASGISVAIQSDGKIVVAGFAGSSTPDVAVARYNSDGSLDSTFGSGGKVTTDFGDSDIGTSVAIQSDGKIVVAGFTFTGFIGSGAGDFIVARYQTDGSLDSTFGTGGKVTTDFVGDESGEGVPGVSVSIQGNGRIVVAGTSTVLGSGTGADFALARYHADGSLDSTFGTGGMVITNFGGADTGYAVAAQSDGRIAMAGWVASQAGNDFGVARYDSDGSLDTTFGTGGKVTTDFGDVEPGLALVVQSDRKIIVAGLTDGGGDRDFALARYEAGLPGATLAIPGIGWPGLLALGIALAALVLLAANRTGRLRNAPDQRFAAGGRVQGAL